MTDLERLFYAMPALQGVGPAAAYLRLHWGDDSGESAVDADVEWGEDPNQEPRLSVAVTEYDGGQRRPVLAAIFQVGTGDLVATGPSVSLSKNIAGQLQREAVLRTLIEELKGLKPLESVA